MDPLVLLVPLERMVLVAFVVILGLLVLLENRDCLDHLVHLERRDPLASLVLL